MKDDVGLVFTLNGAKTRTQARPDTTLATILRDELCQTGTKLGCAIGRCGACTVLLDGEAVNACLLMAWQIEGRAVTTIEGLREDRRFAPLFDALAEANAFQCGYCAPGVTMALAGLFTRDGNADEEAIRTALEGHICRCTGYHSILRGARHARDRLNGAP